MATYDNIALLGGDASTFVAIIGTTTWEELNAAYESGWYTRFVAYDSRQSMQYYERYWQFTLRIKRYSADDYSYVFTYVSGEGNIYSSTSTMPSIGQVIWRKSVAPHDEYWTGKPVYKDLPTYLYVHQVEVQLTDNTNYYQVYFNYYNNDPDVTLQEITDFLQYRNTYSSGIFVDVYSGSQFYGKGVLNYDRDHSEYEISGPAYASGAYTSISLEHYDYQRLFEI